MSPPGTPSLPQPVKPATVLGGVRCVLLVHLPCRSRKRNGLKGQRARTPVHAAREWSERFPTAPLGMGHQIAPRVAGPLASNSLVEQPRKLPPPSQRNREVPPVGMETSSVPVEVLLALPREGGAKAWRVQALQPPCEETTASNANHPFRALPLERLQDMAFRPQEEVAQLRVDAWALLSAPSKCCSPARRQRVTERAVPSSRRCFPHVLVRRGFPLPWRTPRPKWPRKPSAEPGRRHWPQGKQPRHRNADALQELPPRLRAHLPNSRRLLVHPRSCFCRFVREAVANELVLLLRAALLISSLVRFHLGQLQALPLVRRRCPQHL